MVVETAATPPEGKKDISDSIDLSRRVIFPSLHGAESVRRGHLKRGRSDQPTGGGLSKTSSTESMHSSLKVEPGQSRDLASILPLAPLQPRQHTEKIVQSNSFSSPIQSKRNTRNSTRTAERSDAELGDSLVIPPFKRKLPDLSVLNESFAQSPTSSITPFRTEGRTQRYSVGVSLRTRPIEACKAPPTSILRTMRKKPQLSSPMVSPPGERTGLTPPASESIPSLVGLKEDDGGSSESSAETAEHSSPNRQHSSSPSGIVFDPRVWVVEFERSDDERRNTWFTPEEMEQFKREALARVMACQESTELVPTGTGRLVQRPVASKPIYALKALRLDGEDDDYENLVELETIRNVLVLHPLDMILSLFVRSFKTMLPHVKVVTAHSIEEAMCRIAGGPMKGFDVMVVEERLDTNHQRDSGRFVSSQSSPLKDFVSGSQFIKSFSSSKRVDSNHQACLFVGVSSHFEQDKTTLANSGADLIWPLPPPKMDGKLREELLKLLLAKRSKQATVSRLFPS